MTQRVTSKTSSKDLSSKSSETRMRVERRKPTKITTSSKTRERKPGSKTEQEQICQDKASTKQNQYSHDHSKVTGNSEVSHAVEIDDTKQTNEYEDWEAIYEAAKLLGEVKDIQDELHMLKAVVAGQEFVWNTLTDHQDNSRRRMGNNSVMERGPADILGELEEINRLVDSIETSLPTSFLTSMFALNVTSFQHDASGNLLYQPTFIFPIIFCVSIGLGVMMIIIPALFYPDIGEFWRNHWNGLHKQPRMATPPPNSQKSVNPKETNQDSTNKNTSQSANQTDAPSKGTEASSRPLKSYLRNLRSSLRSRPKSEIVHTEKGVAERPNKIPGNRHKG